MEITKTVAKTVLETVDCGLVSGIGQPTPGLMCVEAAVCYALGLPHGDDPGCVSPAIRSLKITLNDSSWSSTASRAAGMRRLALAQLGSKDQVDDVEFAKRVAIATVNKVLPPILLSIGLNDHAKACQEASTLEAARAASWAARAANAAARAARAASEASWAAWNAASWAASEASWAANAASWAAWNAASWAANAARAANAASAASDKILADFAEMVVQVLIEMKAPGCQWLYLTE